VNSILFLLVAGVLLAIALAAVLPRLRNRRAPFGYGFQMNGGAVLKRLREERQACIDFMDQTLAAADEGDQKRDLSDTEKASLETQRKRIGELDGQIEPLAAFEELRGAHQQGAAQFVPTGAGTSPAGSGATGLGVQVNEREHKYRSTGEFLADTYKASSQSRNTTKAQRDAAAERLRSHGLTLEGGSLARAAEPHNTTEEVPGLLPTNIVGEIMSDVDAARPFITSIGARDLGQIPGTSFERPVITQHVQVAKQVDEKDEVANRQFTVGGVPFAKDTYGGWANVSRQSIDWTSPGVWDALMTDFIEQYALETENAAADAFAAAVVQTEESDAAVGADPTLPQLIKALYGAAKDAYLGSGRMPDTIWASLDWWPKLGVLIDTLKATGDGNGGGTSSLNSFNGNLLNTNRIIVPSFPAGTLIVGVKSRTEVYEDRFGFLSVVQPRVFGVELAYGGYMASGTVKPGAFSKVVNAA
jgi:hypothetical protein